MKEILVINTGGTIGSTLKNGIIAPSDEASPDITEGFKREYGEDEKFVVVSPFSKLSENIEPEDISKLCKAVEDNKDKGYKGIIITHGTDTLSYTSALLAQVFSGRLSCPVVMVAAAKPLSFPDSNGHYNFAGAIWLINQLSGSGFYNDVYVTWHDGSVFAAYRGAELTEVDAASHNPGVFGSQPFAEFYPEGLSSTGERYIWRLAMNDLHNDRCECAHDANVLKAFANNGFLFPSGISFLRLYPGFDFSSVNVTGLKAVLVYGFHSGTFPATGKEADFAAFVKRTRNEGVRVYAAPFREEPDGVYESVSQLGNDFTRIYDVSFEAARAYVMIEEGILLP